MGVESFSEHSPNDRPSLFEISRSLILDDCHDVTKVTADDGTCLDPQLEALQRQSIYSKATVTRLNELRGIGAVKEIVSGPRGILLQSIVFLSCVFTTAAHGLVFEWALWKDDIKAKRMDHIPGMLYLAYYFFSCVIGHGLTAYSRGTQGLKECWQPSSLLALLPIGCILAFSESLDNFILLYATSDVKGVAAQLRVACTAVVAYLLFRRRQSALQWILIMSITVCILGYSFVRLTSNFANDVSAAGIFFALTQVVASSVANTLADNAFKKIKSPFAIQMAQARFSSLISTVFLVAIYCAYLNCWDKLPFAGWNYRIVLLAIWLSLKDYSQSLIIKMMSAVWRGLAGSVALAFTYIFQTFIRGDPWNPILITFICCLIADIVAYAMSNVQPSASKTPAASEKDPSQ